MKKCTPLGLAALTALVTGCPHNDYTIEMTPRGNVVERKLAFYRADGTDAKGAPKYQSFPSNELAAITALYPRGAMTQQGERHFALGEFSGAMPADIGGAGSYTNYTTSLGSAGFYLERFRGNDDLYAQQQRRLTAADQLAELVAGWSLATLQKEPGYESLRRFLDVEFRRDLKNLGLYLWAGEFSSLMKPRADEEFLVRFGQYLVEHGYLVLTDAPKLMRIVSDKDNSQLPLLIQRLVSKKLGVPASGPMPTSLGFLADPEALQASWKEYLAGTKAYHLKLQQWEEEKKLKPDATRPDPSDVADDLFVALATSGSSGEDGHISVRLSLPYAPDQTNGKWDETSKQVGWDSHLEAADSSARLPVFCYASWSHADDTFQQAHFGRVILNGKALLDYCLWYGGLDKLKSDEWEKFLSQLRPGDGLTNRLAAFEFTVDRKSGEADLAKDLLKGALEQKP